MLVELLPCCHVRNILLLSPTRFIMRDMNVFPVACIVMCSKHRRCHNVISFLSSIWLCHVQVIRSFVHPEHRRSRGTVASRTCRFAAPFCASQSHAFSVLGL
jgi:hypothetical protein